MDGCAPRLDGGRRRLMRVRRLTLDRFGRFSGKAFEFGPRREGGDFHVILGANEAGKTTTMEGFLRLLFGFERSDRYAFLHAKKDLRVSGVLELNGTEQSFVRLPGRRGGLRDGNENEVAETAISAHLGNLQNDEAYRNLLCLDDDTIEEGGKEIVNAGGDIGRILFSATSGVANLSSVLEAARKQAEGLYKSRGSKSRMAALKRERTETSRGIKEIDVTASAWRKLEKDAENAKESEREARSAFNALNRRKEEAEGRLRALPDLITRDGLAEEIAGFAGYPERLDVDPERISELATQHATAEADRGRLMQEIEGAQNDLDGIELDKDRLKLAESLTMLDELRSRASTASLDLPRRRDALREAMQDMARLAGDLGAAKDADVTALVIPDATIRKLEKAWKAVTEAEARCKTEEGEVADCERRVREAKDALDALSAQSSGLEGGESAQGGGDPAHGAGLEQGGGEAGDAPAAASAESSRQGGGGSAQGEEYPAHGTGLERGGGEAGDARAAASAENSGLGGGGSAQGEEYPAHGTGLERGGGEAGDARAAASAENSGLGGEGSAQGVSAADHAGGLLERFGAETLTVEAATARQAVKLARKAYEDELAGLGVADGNLPDCPVDLAAAEDLAAQNERIAKEIDAVRGELTVQQEQIAAKDAGIDVLKANSGLNDSGGVAAARAERDGLWEAYRADSAEGNAKAYQAAVRKADEVADSHIEHAAELGQLREMEQVRAEAKARVASKEKRLAALQEELKAVDAQVASAAKAVGASISTPAALVAWVTQHGRAVQARREMERVAADHEATLAKAGRLLEALRPLVALDDPSLEEAVAAAREIAERERSGAEEAKAAAKRLDDSQGDLQRRKETLEKLKAKAEATSGRWNELVAEAFGGALDAAELGESLDLLRTLREHDVARTQSERQVTAMEDDQRMFITEVGELAEAHGVAMDDPHEAFKALGDLVEQATADQGRHDSLSETIEAKKGELVEAESQLRGIDSQRQQIAADFPESAKTDTLDALRRTVGDAKEVIGKRKEIADLEGRILAALGVADMDAARARLEGANETDIKAELAGIESEREQAEENLAEAGKDLGAAQQKLRSVSDGADVAELVERRATIDLEMEETGLDYLERQFGLRLAEEAIRRYRDTHRSGMMEETQTAFAELTGGAYQRLEIESAGKGGAEILRAIHADGTIRRVDDLSKGTRFQLYLALRAAAYMELVSKRVCLPFFCDDVFETFDDERTRAACRLMERIGRSGQAIYLTHHKHVVDIAREVCETEPVLHGFDE